MVNRDFINNTNINESNSLVDLFRHIDPDFDNEINIIDHSLYVSDVEFRDTIDRSKGTLKMLNLNCAGLSAKFDKLKIFLSTCNNQHNPISVITLQETHITATTDLSQFDIPEYTLISDITRINNSGGIKNLYY